MNDANTSSPASPRHSHTSSISSFSGWKTGQRNENKAEPGCDRTRGRSRGAPGARARDRERERKRWCSWTCSSTMAADDGCTRRITASSKFEAAAKNDKTSRESVTGRYTLRGAPPRREKRERKRLIDRMTDRSSLAWVADLFCSSLHLAVRTR